MANLVKETCVGVLYVDQKTKQLAVHNGRLLVPIPDSNKLTAEVVIIHVPGTNLQPEELHIKNPLAVLRTPYTPPPVCRKQSGGSNGSIVRSGTCIALVFGTNGGSQVKNGRFLYAVTNTGKIVCSLKIDPKTKKIVGNNIRKVVYAHLNRVPQEKRPENSSFIPQIVERTKVVKVMPIPLQATKKRTI
ncbi:hypothetical protein [Brevibacillus brevis]|uniref:hypothetical protein n=1 Tax=Brevibacillus brevis TaxID=1393 RepID=UPI0037CAE1FB